MIIILNISDSVPHPVTPTTKMADVCVQILMGVMNDLAPFIDGRLCLVICVNPLYYLWRLPTGS